MGFENLWGQNPAPKLMYHFWTVILFYIKYDVQVLLTFNSVYIY